MQLTGQAEKPSFIGICGGSGSGKSSLAKALAARFPAGYASLISLDAYYHRKADFPAAIKGNFDHPDSLEASLLAEHLQALARGETVEVPCYDFSRHDRSTETHTVNAAPLIIIDGILLFALPVVAELLDLSVFVDAPADVRLARRLRRDVRERGRTLDDVLEQYFTVVRPMHERFVEAYKLQADLRVSSLDDLDSEVNAVLYKLQESMA